MPDPCPGCGLTLRPWRRTQSRGEAITTYRCDCGFRDQERTPMHDAANAHFHHNADRRRLLPPLDPSIRCDNCGTRGSLRVQRDGLEPRQWVRRLFCVCLSCGYQQQHLEKAPPRPK